MLHGEPIHEYHDTVVLGAGKSGLAAGYYLSQRGRDFVILDQGERPGDSWRQRWDSLRLFSPAHWNSLPGVPFPAPHGTFPSKNEMADYLDAYVRRFQLPVEQRVQVTRVSRDADQFRIACADRILYCSNLVVATGHSARSFVPDFAAQLHPGIQQLHSSSYRRPADVVGSSSLVVGFGTSGADIAVELASAGRRVQIAGEPTTRIPPFVLKIPGNLWWLYLHYVLTIDTPIGRKLRSKISAGGSPLIRYGREEVIASGARHVARVSGVAAGKPLLADGSVADVDSVIWCTGFSPAFDFLDLPDLPVGKKGWPVAPHGAVDAIKGLYFLGLPFQVGLTFRSLLVPAGRDAALVVEQIQRREPAVSARCGIAEHSGLVSKPDEYDDRSVYALRRVAGQRINHRRIDQTATPTSSR